MFIAASFSVSLGWCRVELPAVSKPAIALHIVYADSVSFLCLHYSLVFLSVLVVVNNGCDFVYCSFDVSLFACDGH